MEWLKDYWSIILTAIGFIATWAKWTSKMSEWDKIIPNLSTKGDVESAVKAAIYQLKIDLLEEEVKRLRHRSTDDAASASAEVSKRR